MLYSTVKNCDNVPGVLFTLVPGSEPNMPPFTATTAIWTPGAFAASHVASISDILPQYVYGVSTTVVHRISARNLSDKSSGDR